MISQFRNSLQLDVWYWCKILQSLSFDLHHVHLHFIAPVWSTDSQISHKSNLSYLPIYLKISQLHFLPKRDRYLTKSNATQSTTPHSFSDPLILHTALICVPRDQLLTQSDTSSSYIYETSVCLPYIGLGCTCLEPRSNRSQHKTNGALMLSNSSVNQASAL